MNKHLVVATFVGLAAESISSQDVLLKAHANPSEEMAISSDVLNFDQDQQSLDYIEEKQILGYSATIKSVPYHPNISLYSTVKTNGVVGVLNDSQGQSQELVFNQALKDSTNRSRFIIENTITVQNAEQKDHYYALEVYRQSGSELQHYDTCKFSVAGMTEFTLGCSAPVKDFIDQEYLYLRFGIATTATPKQFSAVKTYRVKNPHYQTNLLTSVKVNSPAGVINSTVTVSASSFSGNRALYEFKVHENGSWVTKQSFSSQSILDIKLLKEGTQKIRVFTKDERSNRSYDDYADLTVKVHPKPTSGNHTLALTHFSGDIEAFEIQGYSYLKGVQIPNSADLTRQLKVVHQGSGTLAYSQLLSNEKMTSFTSDFAHGNGQINYDWAKWGGKVNLSALPTGTYLFKLETTAKGYAFESLIPFSSAIPSQSYVAGTKQFKFERQTIENSSTLVLSVTDLTPKPDPIPPVTPEPPQVESDYIKNVSQFELQGTSIYMEGYSYIKGIEIPKSHNILHKLKITDAKNKRTIGVYDLTNVKTTSITNAPAHGNGKINYDWAKFKGLLDLSDLPTGVFHVKIYTNAQGSKREEMIKFQTSVTNFSFIADGKLYRFERERISTIPTMILTVTAI